MAGRSRIVGGKVMDSKRGKNNERESEREREKRDNYIIMTEEREREYSSVGRACDLGSTSTIVLPSPTVRTNVSIMFLAKKKKVWYLQ